MMKTERFRKYFDESPEAKKIWDEFLEEFGHKPETEAEKWTLFFRGEAVREAVFERYKLTIGYAEDYLEKQRERENRLIKKLQEEELLEKKKKHHSIEDFLYTVMKVVIALVAVSLIGLIVFIAKRL